MADILSRLAIASQRSRGLRSSQILGYHDEERLRAFFLSFDFDQRRGYFGGGVSDQSIDKYCGTIDWDHTTVIARGGPYCLEAAAILTSLPPSHTAAELSIACPLLCDHEPIIAELLDLAIDVAALRYGRLVVNRGLADPDLLASLRENQAARFGCEHIEIDLGITQWRISAGSSFVREMKPRTCGRMQRAAD
jgi:hypothetical protein